DARALVGQAGHHRADLHAGDRRRRLHGQGERLGGAAAVAVGGLEGEGVGAHGRTRRGAAERGGAVAVVHETDARRQRARLGQGRSGRAGGGDGERPGHARGEGGGVAAGDRRRGQAQGHVVAVAAVIAENRREG